MAKSKLTDEENEMLDKIFKRWHQDKKIEGSDRNMMQAIFDIGYLSGLVMKLAAVDVGV